MICVVCRNGITERGVTTMTLDRGGLTLLVRDVPADVCGNCGEAYVGGDIAAAVYEMGERANADGAELQVREYAHVTAKV